MAEAERIQAEEALSISSQPKLDLGLKEGQRIRLNLNTRRSGDPSDGNSRSRPMPSLKLGAPTGGMPGLIPPPPAPATSGSRSRQALRGNVTSETASVTQSSISSGQSNVDLLAGIFQSPLPPTQTTAAAAGPPASSSAQNANDFSLI